MDQKIEWFGTVRARAGILASPQILLYATGGLAYGEVRTAETVGAGLFGFSNTDTRAGWTVGGASKAQLEATGRPSLNISILISAERAAHLRPR
jgi:outer membrane immunogenic protein